MCHVPCSQHLDTMLMSMLFACVSSFWAEIMLLLEPLGHTLFHLVGCSGLHFPSICSRPLISSLKLLIQPFFLEFDLLFTVNLMRFGMMISACGIKDIQVFVSPVRFLARCLTASRSFLAAHCRRNSFCEHNNSSTLSL